MRKYNEEVRAVMRKIRWPQWRGRTGSSGGGISFEVRGTAMEAQADALMPDGRLVPIGGYVMMPNESLIAALHRTAGELGGVKAVIYLTTI